MKIEDDNIISVIFHASDSRFILKYEKVKSSFEKIK